MSELIFDDSVFEKRRHRFLKSMQSGVSIFFSAPVPNRSFDNDYKYIQDNDFYYLTGFNEPNAACILVAGNKPKFFLFVRPSNLKEEIWEGSRAGVKGAKAIYQADKAYPIDDFDKILQQELQKAELVYYHLGRHRKWDERVVELTNHFKVKGRAGINPPETMIDPSSILHEMRVKKSSQEINFMAKAAQITAKAHIAAMKAVKPGMYEYELEALVEYEFRRQGAMGPAYTSIVGAGANSCTLHYIENSQQINKRDVVLIDAGAYYNYYSADVTRTFPASGKFTREQKAIYNIVLDSQLAVIDIAKPGTSYQDLQAKAAEVITEGLLKVGLLKGRKKDLIKKESYKKFYMHNVGHWLGMDVHDVGRYRIDGEWRKLEAGMVVTVEPGIYISPHLKGVPDRYKGIGVRIEDDVAITKTGNNVLSKAAPKTISEMEALMN